MADLETAVAPKKTTVSAVTFYKISNRDVTFHRLGQCRFIDKYYLNSALSFDGETFYLCVSKYKKKKKKLLYVHLCSGRLSLVPV